MVALNSMALTLRLLMEVLMNGPAMSRHGSNLRLIRQALKPNQRAKN
jgi:hypothetical protein